MGNTISTSSPCSGLQVNRFTVNGSSNLSPPYQQIHVGQDIVVNYDLGCVDHFSIQITDPNGQVVQSVSSSPNTPNKEATGTFSYTTKIPGDYVVSLSMHAGAPNPSSQVYSTKVTAIAAASMAQVPSSNFWAWLIIIIIVILLIWLFWRSTHEEHYY